VIANTASPRKAQTTQQNILCDSVTRRQRTHARDQADGLSRELGGFWDATSEVSRYMGLGKIAGGGAKLAGKAGGGRSALESGRGEPVGQGGGASQAA